MLGRECPDSSVQHIRRHCLCGSHGVCPGHLGGRGPGYPHREERRHRTRDEVLRVPPQARDIRKGGQVEPGQKRKSYEDDEEEF